MRVVAKRRVARKPRAKSVLAAIEARVLRADVVVRIPRNAVAAVDPVPQLRRRVVSRRLGDVVPVVEIPRLVENGIAAGDHELEALALVVLVDRTRLTEPGLAWLVAVADVDVVMAEPRVDVVGRALRILAARGAVATAHAHVTHDDVVAHADLADDVPRVVALVAADAAANRMHRLVVLGLVPKDGLELLLGERKVVPVLIHDDAVADVAVGTDEKVLLRIGPALRLRQREVEHLDFDRHLAEPADLHRAAVDAGTRVLPRVNGQEKLLVLASLERDRLQRLRVDKVRLHRPEALARVPRTALRLANVHLPRRIDPALVHSAVLLREARVVRLLLRVDADEVLVIQQELRTQREARVAEVAVPAVAVLIPDLDDLEVEILGREDLPAVRLEGSQRQRHLAEVAVRLEDERTGLKLVPRDDDPDDPVLERVDRTDVRHALDVAHRRDGERLEIGTPRAG